jgi:hypothetical protein
MFLGILMLGAVLQVVEAVQDVSWGSEVCLEAAAGVLMFCAFRLLWMRRHLAKAARYLIPLLRDPSKVRAVLFRMTDREVIQLSKGLLPDEKQELRWQLIKAAYWKRS